MSYNINYEYINSNNKKITAIGVPCFSSFYGCLSLETFKEITVYVLKDYGKNFSNKMTYTYEEVKTFAKYLNKIHRCIKLKELDDRYAFKINNNNVLATKMMLNMIRYLHEHSYTTIPRHFINMCTSKSLRFLNTYNKMMIAHYNNRNSVGNGHDMLCSTFGEKRIKLLSIKDYKQFITDNTNNTQHYISVLWPHDTAINKLSIHKIRDFVTKGEYNQAYKEYVKQFKEVKVKPIKQEIKVNVEKLEPVINQDIKFEELAF